MPQLDFSNTLTISQVVWMALIFGLLYFLLSSWALPQVASVLDERSNRIDTDLDTARTAKAQADEAVSQLQEATRKASTDAQAAVAAAVASAKADAAEQARIANEALDAQLSEAERRIGDARKSAMGALRNVAAETASEVVSRLTGQAANHNAVDGAVESIMAARG